MDNFRNKKDQEYVRRAKAVIPGTMYGHMSVQRRMPSGYPQFFERAEDCRLWDVDGNEYIDFMCAYGPMILGYQHPVVEEAARRQSSKLETATGPAPVMVELAERLVEQVSHAKWAMFVKNGNDATTTCITIARAATRRKVILLAENAYHGSMPWCTPNQEGVVAGDRAHLLYYQYNNVESLLEAAERGKQDLAGIVVSAFKHDARFDQAMPTLEFAKAVRQVCDENEAALILDDVRAGLRLSLDASWTLLGIQPDLTAWGKALANGVSLSAVTGNDHFRQAAASIFVTGSFWYQASPMAAALATLTLLEEAKAPEYLEKIGHQWRLGLSEQSQYHGIPIRQTGPVQMPMVLFEDDPDFEKGFQFCQAALEEGVYLHPWHNWFLSLAHTRETIEKALEATNHAFEKLAQSLK